MTEMPVATNVESVQDIASAVRSRHRGLVKELWIETEGDHVVLYGRAFSYYGKQMAQEEVIRRSHLSVRANRMHVIE
jgi:hypothetical protein